MLQTTTITGDRRKCIVAFEEFAKVEVVSKKPALVHLGMAIEHSCKLLMEDRDAQYNATMSVDLEVGSLSFTVSKLQ